MTKRRSKSNGVVKAGLLMVMSIYFVSCSYLFPKGDNVVGVYENTIFDTSMYGQSTGEDTMWMKIRLEIKSNHTYFISKTWDFTDHCSPDSGTWFNEGRWVSEGNYILFSIGDQGGSGPMHYLSQHSFDAGKIRTLLEKHGEDKNGNSFERALELDERGIKNFSYSYDCFESIWSMSPLLRQN